MGRRIFEDSRGIFPRGEFDFVRLHQPEIAAGSFSLAENCPISLEGMHQNHCTLFPTTGAGVLRHGPGATDPAAHFCWGPHSAGHQSPAALHVDLHALGQRVTNAPDIGVGYDDPMHLTWVRTTIAHNTVTVDETPMFPYDREEDSIWRTDSPRDHVSDSVLEFFQPGRNTTLHLLTDHIKLNIQLMPFAYFDCQPIVGFSHRC